VVRHLEYDLQHRAVVLSGTIHLDAVDGHLYTAPEADLLQALSDERHASQVPSQGVFKSKFLS
jgi:hypothetical protein